ncbi:hypothetical protein MS3_00008208, partial [Schistosoma haematobium]
INNLTNPIKKMSKSDTSELGIIYLTDTPDNIYKKIRRAETDSIRKITYDIENRPGVSNLLRILSAIQKLALLILSMKLWRLLSFDLELINVRPLLKTLKHWMAVSS